MNLITEIFKPVKHHIQTKARRQGDLLKDVHWTDTPEFAKASKNTPAQITGLRYERAVELKLSTLAKAFGFNLGAHKWIHYNNWSFAQLDFVFISSSGAAILIEVKYNWTDTSSQRKLYTRLLQKLGLTSITSITICHNLTSETPRDKIIHNFHDLKQDSIWQLRI